MAREDAENITNAERITVEMGPGASGPIPISSSRKSKEKHRNLSWKNARYTTRLAVTFAVVAAMTALVSVLVLSFVWERHFQDYTQENMEQLAQQVAENLAEAYGGTGTLYNPTLEAVIRYSEGTYDDVVIAVIDNQTGETIYDSLNPENAKFNREDEAQEEEKGKAVGVDAAGEGEDNPLFVYQGTTLSGSPDATPGSQKFASAPIIVDGVAVGSVRVWVHNSDTLLRQTDAEFRDNSYGAMLIASLVAIVLAVLMGLFFARGLVAPINKLSETAQSIKDGHLDARTGLKSEDEIGRLGQTFDAMAESIEKDRELERRLTTDVAHELRTPLMAIQSTVEAMIDGVFPSDEAHLATVNSEVQRLSRLVGAILRLSRLENRSTPMKEERVDVGELVQNVVDTHDIFVRDSGLDFYSEIEPGVYVLGDRDLIRQATANLISNAVRYTPEGGSITVRVKRGDIMASIAVADTGIGLTSEEARMVFSRFWRADAGRTRERGGLGIGLTLVKEIVERHRGWVNVEGKLGEGSTFTIFIPLMEVISSKKPDAKKANGGRRRGNNKR